MFFTVRHLSPEINPKAVFQLAMFEGENTSDSDTRQSLWYLPWPPWAGDTDRIIPILCHDAHDGQGKYSVECHVSLSLSVSLTIFANVNDP
jgi:hypothetical protein